MPYLVRIRYMRLLFEVYLRVLPEDTMHFEINNEGVYDMMQYVVYEDLRMYGRYYLGLLAKPLAEDRRDNDSEAMRKKTQEALGQKSVEVTRKRNMERTR